MEPTVTGRSQPVMAKASLSTPHTLETDQFQFGNAKFRHKPTRWRRASSETAPVLILGRRVLWGRYGVCRSGFEVWKAGQARDIGPLEGMSGW